MDTTDVTERMTADRRRRLVRLAHIIAGLTVVAIAVGLWLATIDHEPTDTGFVVGFTLFPVIGYLMAARRFGTRRLREDNGGRTVDVVERKEDAVADVERNVDVVRRLEDAYNRRDYTVLGELVRDDLVAHTPSADPTGQNHVGLTANNEGGFSAFADKRTEIKDIFGEGDLVVSRVHQTGTNTGGLPWFGIPANDAKVDFEWIQISRHDADGKIAETWAQMEVPKLMQQLGAMPAPGGM